MQETIRKRSKVLESVRLMGVWAVCGGKDLCITKAYHATVWLMSTNKASYCTREGSSEWTTSFKRPLIYGNSVCTCFRRTFWALTIYFTH